MSIPPLVLNQGNAIPQLGFGVFKIAPDMTQGIVEEALAAGFRHIDTATGYHNEAQVGAAIRASGIPRESIFVTTKLWNDDHRAGNARGGFERSLKALNIDYIDMYLIHWPLPAVDKYVEIWQQLIKIKEEGLTQSIGVCNFQITHLQRIIAETGVAPAVDQVELHPLFQQKELRLYLDDHDINAEAWGPLGQGRYDLFAYAPLTDAAAAHHKSPAQIVLRWHMQSGTIAIPKAANRDHMDENLDIFDFELTGEEMDAIASMDTNHRLASDPDDVN